MALSDYYPRVQTVSVVILTVDPPRNRIEAAMKDGTKIYPLMQQTSGIAVWPKEGEFWSATRKNTDWYLDSYIESPDVELSIADISPGDAKINADSVSLRDGSQLVSTAIEPWHVVGTTGEPAFQNGWTNFGSGFALAAFYKDSLDRVWFKGVVASGSIPSAIFILPEGYRPAEALCFNTMGAATTRIDVYPAGIIGPVSGSNSYLSLDGISFRAAST